MRKEIFYLAMAIVVTFIFGCNGSPDTNEGQITGKDNTYTGPPYTVQVDEIVVPGLPDLHSYTHAIYEDKIVMFGGRTSGLHSSNYYFQTARSNENIYVINTKHWSSPLTWQIDSMPYKNINLSGRPPFPINKSVFIANNAEFFTNNNVLYVLGGLLGSAHQNPITLSEITAINLPDFIDYVTSNGKKIMKPNSIRQLRDTSFALTGAEISMMDNKIYLVFGWNYTANSDYYSHQIKSFTITDNGYQLMPGAITSWSDGHSNGLDSVNEGAYRRRDGSMSAMIDPTDGTNMLLYYAGVFKVGLVNFTSPVWINKNGAKEIDFTMRGNIYTCQVIPVYSKSRKESYATLMGGMTNATYPTSGSVPIELNKENAPIIDTAGRVSNATFAPFTNRFTTIRVKENHEFTQYLLPDSFPATAVSYTIPASATDTVSPFNKDTVIKAGSVMYSGAESEMHWNLNKKYLMPNGVVNYDALMADSVNGASVGYLYGGILSSYANILFVRSSFHYSVASNRLFRVRILPLKK
jgi:hypothetical protein